MVFFIIKFYITLSDSLHINKNKKKHTQGKIEWCEVEGAIRKLKVGEASGIYGISTEMLKYRGDMVVEWMAWICSLAWEQGEVPDRCKNSIIILPYKGKGSRN